MIYKAEHTVPPSSNITETRRIVAKMLGEQMENSVHIHSCINIRSNGTWEQGTRYNLMVHILDEAELQRKIATSDVARKLKAVQQALDHEYDDSGSLRDALLHIIEREEE